MRTFVNEIFSSSSKKWFYLNGRSIEDALPTRDRGEFSFLFKHDGRFGFCDINRNILSSQFFDYARPFQEGYAVVRNNENWGILNRYFEVVWIECNYDGLYFHNLEDSFNGVFVGYSYTEYDSFEEGYVPISRDDYEWNMDDQLSKHEKYCAENRKYTPFEFKGFKNHIQLINIQGKLVFDEKNLAKRLWFDECEKYTSKELSYIKLRKDEPHWSKSVVSYHDTLVLKDGISFLPPREYQGVEILYDILVSAVSTRLAPYSRTIDSQGNIIPPEERETISKVQYFKIENNSLVKISNDEYERILKSRPEYDEDFGLGSL